MAGYVYIMTNRPHGALYIGVTSDLACRAWEHRDGVTEGFTSRYGLRRLVFVEPHELIQAAITRGKTLKTWRRSWKARLIEQADPQWIALYERPHRGDLMSAWTRRRGWSAFADHDGRGTAP